MNDSEKRGAMAACVMAAFADGARVERERDEIRRLGQSLAGEDPALARSFDDVLLGRLELAEVAKLLPSPEARQVAYEMAVCVCDADGTQSAPEKRFLAELRRALALDPVGSSQFADQAEAIAAQPIQSVPPANDAEVDGMIQSTAILCAALEQLPQRLASMAIVPLQMRMVYKIGARYGFTLDKGHILDLATSAGLGLASQVIDGFARQLVGGLARRFAGSFLSGLAGRATSSAVAFGSTYALGHLAKRYYAGGRKLTGAQLREAFTSLVGEARSLEPRYASTIADRARSLDVTDLAALVRSS